MMSGAPAPNPTSQIAQAAMSLSDLLAVLADPAKATAMIGQIRTEVDEYEQAKKAAVEALNAANARHAHADERERFLDRRHQEQERIAEQQRAKAAELTSRESGAAGIEERAKQKSHEADDHYSRIHGGLKEREDAVSERERLVLGREGAVKNREDRAEQLIAQYTGKLESFRRIAVG